MGTIQARNRTRVLVIVSKFLEIRRPSRSSFDSYTSAFCTTKSLDEFERQAGVRHNLDHPSHNITV